MSRSLRKELSFWIATATLIIGVIAAGCSFLLAFKEARELQDDQLRQTALLVDRAGGKVSFWTELDKKVPDNDPEARIIITPLDKLSNDSGAMKNRHLPQIPANVAEGFKTVEMLGENWRLYIHTLPSGQRIATGQQTAVRDEIARDSSVRTLLPMLFLVPALVLLTTAIIRKALTPVMQLSRQLDQRNDAHLHPLSDKGLPDEILPFVTSINSLMQRISEVLAQQRHFIADAAHELRSPLTALSLQAANLDRTLTPEERSQRLEQLRQGLNRASLLLDQLLSLARQQAGPVSSETSHFNRIIRQVVEDVMPLAAAKDIDLGAEHLEDIVVTAPADALSVLVRNAIDNAVRYTPAGGKVDVSLFYEDGQVVFQVEDNGPGIPVGEEKRIFEPFYRVIGSNETGSGLGLTIVNKVVERLGGTVSLCNRGDGKGALFRYIGDLR
jgi:two-component system OmpR family sensor kinase